MSQDAPYKIGLIVGAEWDLPEALMQAIAESAENATAELVKLGGTFTEKPVDYQVILDRMSHKIPYYRAFLKHAVLHGVYTINNPFIWDSDNKFLGTGLINRLNLNYPRTVILPNKNVEFETNPDTFRNLEYPMDWEAIIQYVGVPAVFKDIYIGGRQFASRVHNVDELIQRYDESGTRTTVLQEIIESDDHLHAFVIGRNQVMILHYVQTSGTYRPGMLSQEKGLGAELAGYARKITQIYEYDINMVEFVLQKETIYVINSTNPAPDIDRQLMTQEQFTWCVNHMAELAISRAKRPLPQTIPFTLHKED